MTDWIQKNAWALIVAAVPLIATWSLFGYRITQLEAQATEVQQTINTTDELQVQIQLSLREIETDIKYIKQAIDRVTP